MARVSQAYLDRRTSPIPSNAAPNNTTAPGSGTALTGGVTAACPIPKLSSMMPTSPAGKWNWSELIAESEVTPKNVGFEETFATRLWVVTGNVWVVPLTPTVTCTFVTNGCTAQRSVPTAVMPKGRVTSR